MSRRDTSSEVYARGQLNDEQTLGDLFGLATEAQTLLDAAMHVGD